MRDGILAGTRGCLNFRSTTLALPPRTPKASMSTPASTSLPTKRIVSKAHLDAWLSSSTHSDVVTFVEKLNESVVGVKLTDSVLESEVSYTALCRRGCIKRRCTSDSASEPEMGDSTERHRSDPRSRTPSSMCSTELNRSRKRLHRSTMANRGSAIPHSGISTTRSHRYAFAPLFPIPFSPFPLRD